MNEINNIVFDVYKGVLEMDYTKNIRNNTWDKFKKLVRYILSGYIFKYKSARKEMEKLNVFQPTNDIYNNVKLVIYTVSTGKYDNIKEPIYIDDNIDYYIFTEQNISDNSVWKKKEIPEFIKKMPALDQARYIKTHPHEFFTEYDYSMFIDGNIRITCDIKPLFYTLIASKKIMAIHKHQVRNCIYDEAKAIYAAGKANKKNLKEQMSQYKKDGFPPDFGLFETNIVIREHNSLECKKIMNDWWKEMDKWTKRDQLSFTYSLWKNGKLAEDVLSLGNNSRRNPYFIVDSHK